VLAELVAGHLDGALSDLRLPVGEALSPKRWVDAVLLGKNADARVGEAVDQEFVTELSRYEVGNDSAQWAAGLRRQVAARRGAGRDAAREIAESDVWTWHHAQFDLTLDVVKKALAERGLRYTVALLEAVKDSIASRIVPELDSLTGRVGAEPFALASDVEDNLGKLRGVLRSGQAILDDVVASLRASTKLVVRTAAAERAALVLASYCAHVLDPLIGALDDQLTTLRRAQSNAVHGVSVARPSTDVYQAWPDELSDKPPARFQNS
jgi:hypothetical protein